MYPVGKLRSPAVILGLSVITLGIYYLYWYYSINEELRQHDPQIEVVPVLAMIATLIPLCNLVTAFGTADRIRQIQLQDGNTSTISPIIALLLTMFLGFAYPLYVGSHLRQHWLSHS